MLFILGEKERQQNGTITIRETYQQMLIICEQQQKNVEKLSRVTIGSNTSTRTWINVRSLKNCATGLRAP